MRLRSIIVVALAGVATAIRTTPGSQCSTKCGNSLGGTATDELECNQDQYAGGEGETYQQCLECQMTSGYSTQDETDTQWALYNLRYAVSYCLFGNPNNEHMINTPCITSEACGPFQNAIIHKNMSTSVGRYEYCSKWPVDDALHIDGCTSCLRAGGQEYLANFVTVLHAGCEQLPIPGIQLGLEGDVFSTETVNATAASAIPSADPDWFDQGPLDAPALIGIAAGGLVVILVITGFCIIWNGRRKRRAFLRRLESKYNNKGWPVAKDNNGGDYFDTPMSQRPLRSWDDSPSSAQTEKPYQRYYSPYSSQYNSPVNGQDATAPQQWPMEAAIPSVQQQQQPQQQQDDRSAIAAAMNGQFTQDHWRFLGDDKGKGRELEAYEMHDVDLHQPSRGQEPTAPPILAHPGYGRTSTSPHGQYYQP